MSFHLGPQVHASIPAVLVLVLKDIWAEGATPCPLATYCVLLVRGPHPPDALAPSLMELLALALVVMQVHWLMPPTPHPAISSSSQDSSYFRIFEKCYGLPLTWSHRSWEEHGLFTIIQETLGQFT